MAFLTPDSTYTAKVGDSSITVKVKITPDGARAQKDICSYVKKGDLVKPNAKLNNGTGKPKGITVHNTNNISVASGTNPAEQYARATYPNGNMNGVAVHYWVYKNEIWQQLADNERGWHAADGSSRRSSQRVGETIGGNLDTISIECIETGSDAVSEDTTAKLVAYLLNKYGLSPDTDIYTHNYFYSAKYCPAYILPHWKDFLAKCKAYYNAMQSGSGSGGSSGSGTSGDTLYRVQVGAYTKKENAEAMLAKLKAAGFDGFITTAKKDGGSSAEAPAPTPRALKAGDLVKITGTKYYSGANIPAWVKAKNWYITEVKGERAVIDKSEDGKNAICSPVNTADLKLVKAGS